MQLHEQTLLQQFSSAAALNLNLKYDTGYFSVPVLEHVHKSCT